MAIYVHGDRYGKDGLLCALVATVASICRTKCLNSLLICPLWPNSSQKVTGRKVYLAHSLKGSRALSWVDTVAGL